MDTMGDEATYTWVSEYRKIRVSLGEKDSDTYFQASLNETTLGTSAPGAIAEGGPLTRRRRLSTPGWMSNG